MLKLIIFCVVSVLIVAVSWRSLRRPRSHGFFRFFAFEFLLVLILLNIDYWFADPFSPLHVISWLLLISSFILVIAGYSLLRAVGKPTGQRESDTTLGFESTTTLVTVGVYHYIRHPLYSSLLVFGWGVFLKDPTLVAACLVLAASSSLLATAKAEETEDLQRFGNPYAEYMKSTKMFIPFVW